MYGERLAGVRGGGAYGGADLRADDDGDTGGRRDIANCTHSNNEATAGLLGRTLRSLTADGSLPPLSQARVIALGDNAYFSGTRAQFANCYDNYRLSDGSTYDRSRPAWWGQYKNRTMPILGNHEYLNSSDLNLKSTPYFDYFKATNGFKQPPAPVPNTSTNPGLRVGKVHMAVYDAIQQHRATTKTQNLVSWLSGQDWARVRFERVKFGNVDC